jgi:hypothetical protein
MLRRYGKSTKQNSSTSSKNEFAVTNSGEERTWKWKGQKFKNLSKQILMEVILGGIPGDC